MISPSSFQDLSFIEAGFCDAKESLENPPPFLMNQVHGADVIILDKLPTNDLDCDALITTTPRLQLTIKTADCAPVLFVDTEKHIIGATHAGWKGAFQGILEQTILTMISLGARCESIRAAIGPHLTKEHFQISEEMRALFPKTEHRFFETTAHGIYFDFTGYLCHRLTRAGLKHIENIPIDTFANTDYNSYRRDALNPARQFSFITLK